MKMTRTLLSSLLLSALLFSCNQAPKQAESQITKSSTEVKKAAEPQIEKENTLSLNEGEKWIANPETTEGVNNMISLIKAFEESEDIDQYHHLQESIRSEFNLIFKRCTMKGKAHDQLHHFLIPIKSFIDILGKEDLKASQKAVTDLNEHLKQYKEYFV